MCILNGERPAYQPEYHNKIGFRRVPVTITRAGTDRKVATISELGESHDFTGGITVLFSALSGDA